MPDPTGEVVELLQQLIRNRCVNDGTLASGQETRSADTVASYLEGAGVDLQRFEPAAGRGSLVARIEGSDPSAPSLCLMGHLDVVPVSEENWERDPFGGELVDGMVWGRGAIDMLNITASMAVAFKALARGGFRPRGTLVYFACADEEALGTWGAQWMTEHEPDAVRADYVLTELGGMRLPLETGGGPKLAVMVGEKGTFWCRLRVRGTAGHASQGSFRTDNALVKAAEVVRRLGSFRAPARMTEPWRRFVEAMGFDPQLRDALLDPHGLEQLSEQLPIGLGQTLHSCTHTTIAPTIMHAGVKTNIIPDAAEIQVDVRTLPGETPQETRALLREALGDLWEAVEIVEENPSGATESPVGSPLWDVLTEVTASLVPEAQPVPFLLQGATDARFFRRLGMTAYGYGLLSDRIGYDEFMAMFHAHNERVDVESLRLSAELWRRTAERLLAG